MAGFAGTRSPNHPIMRGLKVVMVGFAAMQVAVQATKADEKLSMANFLGCMLLLLAFSFMVTANYMPPDDWNLAVVFDQVGVFLGTTSVFLLFFMFVPPLLWMKVVYGGVYLVLVIIIILCSCNRIVNEPGATRPNV